MSSASGGLSAHLEAFAAGVVAEEKFIGNCGMVSRNRKGKMGPHFKSTKTAG